MTDTLPALQAYTALKQAYDESLLGEHCELLETILHYFEGDTTRELKEYIQENYIDAADIIGYHNAMKFLKENDPSLSVSLGLAYEYGYTCEKLSSETLATMLLHEMLAEELTTLLPFMEDYFDALKA